MSIDSTPEVVVSRPVYSLEQINESQCYAKENVSSTKRLKTKLKRLDCGQLLTQVFPFLCWIKSYSIRKDFPLDIISGCTVAIMHIPQGMAYALLANVPPVVGLYTAFVPVIAFFFFGSSRHNSMGTFAVVSIMVGKVVLAQSNLQPMDAQNDLMQNSLPTAMEVVSTLCFLIGIIQCAMYLVRAGVIATILSDVLVSGFTTGAAVHVLTSQVKDLVGLSIPKFTGNFDVLFTYIEIFKHIEKANLVTLALSITTCVILISNNEILKPKIAKLTILPIPMELILVIGGTVASHHLYLSDRFGVDTIKEIPTGFPGPSLPSLSNVQSLIVDAMIIAIVSYSITVSMALIFAKKEDYKVDFNQELLAMGIGNLLGSSFSCIPYAASLSRSVIQHAVGGKTQIASLVSCSILVFILLWIGPFFEDLPKAVLAGIIVVSLKGLLWQFKDFLRFWKQSRTDAFIWLCTVVTVVAVAIDVGLMVGVVLSIMCIVVKGLRPSVCLLGNLPGTEIYLDISEYKKAQEIPQVKIFHYAGCLNFASHDHFKSRLYEMVNFERITCGRNISNDFTDVYLKAIILDFSGVSYIDATGGKTVCGIVDDMRKWNIEVLIISSSSPIFERLKMNVNVRGYHGPTLNIYPTVHDAVQISMGTTSANLQPIPVG